MGQRGAKSLYPIAREIQIEVASRREKDRETQLRRNQNELAEMKKLLRLTADADTKTADIEKGIDTNG